ncbi:hypothetical protein ACQ86N_44670 [Puia sp. P3]|uniref:hypothetical protein n=1 Tax=Puia sp. P3 TaxID=3423952 RepID=UPI003D678EB8
MIEIDEVIHASTQEQLETGKKEFKLGFDQKNDSIIVYTAEPYDTRPRYQPVERPAHRISLSAGVHRKGSL